MNNIENKANNGFLQGSLNFWNEFSKNAPQLMQSVYSSVIPSCDAALINFLGSSSEFSKVKADFAVKPGENGTVEYKLRLIYFTPSFKDVDNDIEPETKQTDMELLKNSLSSTGFFKALNVSFDLKQGLVVITGAI